MDYWDVADWDVADWEGDLNLMEPYFGALIVHLIVQGSG
jgi:hypothetical protein